MDVGLELREIARLLRLQHERIRENPQSLIPILLERLNKFTPDGIYFDRPGVGIKTNEGTYPIQELINELMMMKGPLQPLRWSEPLHMAADDHAQIIQMTGIIQPMDVLGVRVNKYAVWDGHISQSIQYCYGDPQQLIINLLIDDGIPLRGNRRNILNPEFSAFGIGLASHKDANLVAVFTYGSNIMERAQLLVSEPLTPMYGWSCSCLLF